MPSSVPLQPVGATSFLLLSPFLFSTALPSQPSSPPPIQQRLFTGGIFSEEVNDQLIDFARRHRVRSRVWVPVRCFETILKPFGVTLRPAAALLAVASTERSGGDGGGRGVLGLFSFCRKGDGRRGCTRYGEGTSTDGRDKTGILGQRAPHSFYLYSSRLSRSTPSLQHNVLVNAEHTSHCCFLEQFQAYAIADAAGRREGRRGMGLTSSFFFGGTHTSGGYAEASPLSIGSMTFPSPMRHSSSWSLLHLLPPQALQSCDHPLTVEGEPLLHLRTVQLMKQWRQRCGFTSPYWTREPPPLQVSDARERGTIAPAVSAVNVGGWYPIEAHPLCGRCNPVWCMSYTPHTLTNQPFPFLIARLMRERAAQHGFVSRLWLTPEEAWRLFHATLRPDIHTSMRVRRKGGEIAERWAVHQDPPIWCSYFTGGLQQDVYYCADQYTISPSHIPRGRETNMAACGVDIGPTKLQPFPPLASLFRGTTSSSSAAALMRSGSFTMREPKNISSLPSVELKKSKGEGKTNFHSSYTLTSAARQERLAALREKYREVRLFDTGVGSTAGNSLHEWIPELEAHLSRERFLRGFSSPYFLRSTSVLRYGLTLREDGQQGIVVEVTETMQRRGMPFSIQQECWINASQLTEPAVVHELAEHPPTSLIWEQPLHGIIAANCARLQLLFHHRGKESATSQKEDKNEDAKGIQRVGYKVAEKGSGILQGYGGQETGAPAAAHTVENKWVLAQAIPVIPRWRLREGAVGVPFLNYDDASPAAPTHQAYPFIWYNLNDVLGVTAEDRVKLDRYQPVDETSLPVSSVALKVFLTLRALQAGFHSPVWVQLQEPWKEKYLPLRQHIRRPPRRGPSNVFALILPSSSNLVIYRGEVYMNYEEYNVQILGNQKRTRPLSAPDS